MSIMKKRIVLVNQSSGFLVVDDLNAYCTKYDCVSILCAGIKEGVRSINPKVKIDKICKYNKASTLRRLLTWSLGTIQVLFKLLFKYRNFEVVYYTNPPMACFSALLLRNKFRIVEYDIYPNALEAIGISDRHIIYRIWKSIKKKLYAKADAIYTLSEGMKEILLEYGEAEKIKVVPLWSASDDFKPICKEQNPFVKEHHLENKFVVMYSGNIGYTHSVECLIEVAKNMQTDNDVKFLMIGEGKKKTDLEHAGEIARGWAQLRPHVDENGVAPDHGEKERQPVQLQHVRQQVEQGQQEIAPARRPQHHGAGKQMLDDRKIQAPDISQSQTPRA